MPGKNYFKTASDLTDEFVEKGIDRGDVIATKSRNGDYICNRCGGIVDIAGDTCPHCGTSLYCAKAFLSMTKQDVQESATIVESLARRKKSITKQKAEGIVLVSMLVLCFLYFFPYWYSWHLVSCCTLLELCILMALIKGNPQKKFVVGISLGILLGEVIGGCWNVSVYYYLMLGHIFQFTLLIVVIIRLIINTKARSMKTEGLWILFMATIGIGLVAATQSWIFWSRIRPISEFIILMAIICMSKGKIDSENLSLPFGIVFGIIIQRIVLCFVLM